MAGAALATVTSVLLWLFPTVRVARYTPSSVQVIVVRAAARLPNAQLAPASTASTAVTLHCGVPAPVAVPDNAIGAPSTPDTAGPASATPTGSTLDSVGTTGAMLPSALNTMRSIVVSRWVPSP